MRFAMTSYLKPLSVLCALLTFLGGPAIAQSESSSGSVVQSATVGSTGWGVQCNNVNDDLVCSALISVVSNQNNQLILRLAVQRQADSDDHILVVQLPLGLSLPRGIDVIVDDGDVRNYEINTCIPAGCFVNQSLNATQLDTLKAGNKIAVIVTSNNGNENRIELPLAGFTKAVEKLQ